MGKLLFSLFDTEGVLYQPSRKNENQNLSKCNQNLDVFCANLNGICKTKSDRKSGNFSFQWTRTLYQNNFKYITVLFAFSKS